jgi:drug/metabolite transporter (DMT)-like permease
LSGHLALYLLIVLMTALWSGNYIIGKIALRQFPPLLLSGLRVTLAGCFIGPVYWWTGKKAGQSPRWGMGDLPILIYLGLFGVALNQLFFVMGLSRTSVAHAAILIALTPICVLLIAALLGMERITSRKLAGMIIALAGVGILNAFPVSTGPGSRPTLLGDFLTFLAALTFSLFTVIGKRVTERHSSVTVNTFAYVGGALALGPITAWEASRFSFAGVTASGWLSLTYMALFPSVVCYLIYYHALKHISASRVSAFSYLQPVLAMVMAVVILGEHVTLPLVAAAAVIFAGVYMTERG